MECKYVKMYSNICKDYRKSKKLKYHIFKKKH